MAELHEATLTPRKDELLAPWLPTRPWWDGIDGRGPAGSFRLDDPDGEVGMECFLLGSTGGSTLFVPLTYRAAEMPGAARHLVGTLEHSVLGTRWVYDACGDPVFVSAVVDLIRSGGTEAEQLLHREDGSVTTREPTATARGVGASELHPVDASHPLTVVDEATRTIVTSGEIMLAVTRRVGAALPNGADLTGSFAGGSDLVLATASHLAQPST